MPNDVKKPNAQEGASPESEGKTTVTQSEGGTEQQEQTPQVQTAPLSVQEYIDQAPEGMRDVLSASLKVHEEKKATAIKALVDSKQCKFSDEFLKAQSLENLENMVALLPGTYNGVAAPSNPQVQAGNSNETVPAPRVFAKKSATTEAA